MGSISRRVVWPSIGGPAMLRLIGVAVATWPTRALEPEIQVRGGFVGSADLVLARMAGEESP